MTLPTTDRRRFLLNTAALGASALGVGALAGPALAQALPETIRLICGFPPGGTADSISRWTGEPLNGVLARSVIVDNKPGAGGRIAIETLKGTPADGRTMLLTPSSTLAMYPFVYSKLSYDPQKDLAPVGNVCDFEHCLAVGPAVPAEVKDLQDFVKWCKAHPDKANCGNTGDGSMPHFITIMLSKDLGVKIEPVPYKGTGPGMSDLLGGQVSALIAPEGSFPTYVEDGKVRLLGTSGKTTSRFFPKVKTFAEQGAPNVVVREWFGLFMPAATPADIRERTAAAVATALQPKGIQERFAKIGMMPVGSTPAVLADQLKTDLAFWGPTVKAIGFNPLSS